jgi:S1-C subfamily serine protease
VLIGDVLVSLGGTAVSDTDDIKSVLEGHAVGSTIAAGILRGGVPANVGVVIGERSKGN